MKKLVYSKVKPVLYLLLFFVFLISCEKENKINNTYLVSSSLLYSYTANQVFSNMTLASILYPDLDTLLPESEYGVKIYKVTYKTQLEDEEVIASGIISIPANSGAFPILSFQNGTNTCNSNAPSENTTNQLFTLISLAAGNGYIVTIPDYIGFGESETIHHPYHHRHSSENSVIDLIKATRELISNEDEASFNGNLFLMGYSQGGWATFSVLNNLELNPIDGITLAAADFGAGAYDLYEMGKFIVASTEYPNPFYLPYFIESRISNGIMNEPLNVYFNEPYASNIPQLFDGSLCNTEMNAEFPSAINELLTPELIADFETAPKFETLRQQLISNSIPAWNLQTQVRMYHSTGDKSVPSFETQELYDNLLGAGVSANKMQLVIIEDENLDHSDAVVPWGIDALAWFGSLNQ